MLDCHEGKRARRCDCGGGDCRTSRCCIDQVHAPLDDRGWRASSVQGRAQSGSVGGGVRVLVTGSSGFIGTNLVGHLATKDDVEAVVGVDIQPPKWRPEGATFVALDVMDRQSLLATVARVCPTHIVHLAARTDMRGATIAEYAVNYGGVANVALAAERSGAHFVSFSSRLVFRIGAPVRTDYDYSATTDYGVSKIIGEQVARLSRCKWTIIRPTSLWGPWFGTPYADFFRAVSRRRYLHVCPRRRIFKQFGYIGNAVVTIERLLNAPIERTVERVFWLADYEPLEVGEWADLIASEFGVAGPSSVPVLLLRGAAAVGDVLQRRGIAAPITSFRLSNLLTDMRYDLGATREVAGALPSTVAEGTQRTVEWIRSRDGSIQNGG